MLQVDTASILLDEGKKTWFSITFYLEVHESVKIFLFYQKNYILYTNKKENQIFLIYKEIQNGAVANS